MLRIHGKVELPRPLKKPVVTLGVFDGVHLGHQQLIRELIRWAREIGGESVVLTFDPHPQVVISEVPASLITSLEHRLVLFEQLGVDVCAVIEFNHDLALVTAEDFAREYLSRWLGAHGILAGFDCRFGRGARGNIDLLRALAPELGFEVRAFEQFHLGELVPSSTVIRNSIASGDLDKASAKLGRPVSILGEVVKGDGRGRELGFPTANIDPHHEVLPPHGIYACRVEIDGIDRLAVTNIGLRPTIEERQEPVIEVHVLDYDGDLYGRVLEVRFFHRLRDERKFRSLEALKAQIAKDIALARRLLTASA
jgi:riboflavin kinase/FMN adenylyltransferase